MIILSIGESRPKKWKVGAAVIEAVEGLDHTHSFISWKDTRLGIRKVGESRGGGGRIITNHQFKEENEVVRIFQYKIEEAKLDELEIWMWENLRPYGFKHNLGLGIMRLENLVYKTVDIQKCAKNRFKDGDYSLICVEFSAKALQLALNMDFAGDTEDYGLREMHEINMNNFRNKLCDLAPIDMIKRINRVG